MKTQSVNEWIWESLYSVKLTGAELSELVSVLAEQLRDYGRMEITDVRKSRALLCAAKNELERRNVAGIGAETRA